MTKLYIHLTPRLSAALEMLEDSRCVADIGCDHGRLTAALLQKQICERVVASDISEPSLQKAKQLIRLIGMTDRVSFRVGDGCSVLHPYECDAIVLLGMGGTLMRRILEACTVPLAGAQSVVLQPMRAQDDIRRYLYENGFRIQADRIVSDHGRLYQVLKAIPGTGRESLPEGFPEDFFDIGYRSFAEHDELLPDLCLQQLSCHEKMLGTAAGTDGETVLMKKIAALKQILQKL